MATVANTSWYRTGSVDVTQNSAVITGTNTRWTAAGINPGATFRLDDDLKPYEVLEVVDDTHITLRTPFLGTTGTGKTYSIDRNFQSTPMANLCADVATVMHKYETHIDAETNTVTGKSAYQIACDKGYVGTESEWAASLKGDNAYQVAVANGYTGTVEEWLESLKAAGEWETAQAGIAEANSAISAVNSKISSILYNSGHAHNSIYRGKNLGSSLTAEQSAAISNGTFTDIYIGDYWQGLSWPAYTWTDSQGVEHEEAAGSHQYKWTICGLDYFYTYYGPHYQMLTHHVLVWPEACPMGGKIEARMNSTATTEGGYVGSEFFTNNILKYEALLKAIWGDNHLVRYSMEMCNAVTDGKETGFARYSDRICDLFTLNMLGAHSNRHTGMQYAPLPITMYYPNVFAGNGGVSYLQDVASATSFYVLHTYPAIATWGPTDYISGCANPFFLLH